MTYLKKIRNFANDNLILFCVLVVGIHLLGLLCSPLHYIAVILSALLLALLTFERSIQFIVFLLPFQGVTLIKFMGTRNVVFVYIAFMIVIQLGYYLINCIASRKRLNLPIIITSTLLSIYSMFNFTMGGGAIRIVRFMCVIVFVYLLFVYRDKFSYKIVINYLSYAIIFSFVLSIGFMIFGGRQMVMYASRFQALSGHPNTMQIQCSLALLGLLVMYIRNQIPLSHFAIVVPLVSIVGVLTMSKAFLIVFVMLLIVYFVHSIRINTKKGCVQFACFAVACAILIPIFWDKISGTIGRFTEFFQGTDILNQITTGRVAIWKTYFQSFVSNSLNIIFGVGISAELPVAIGPHNDFVYLIYHLGLVGCLLLIWWFVTYLVQLKNVRDKINWQSVLIIFILIFISMEENLLTKNEIIISLALVSSILYTKKIGEKNNMQNQTNGKKIKTNDSKIKISVLTSVYKNDVAKNVRVAFESILNQTYKPSQIVVVRDGAVGEELQTVLDEYKKNKLFTIVERDQNIGLGKTLAEGTGYCKYDYIARMDSDDVALPSRFMKQVQVFEADPEVSLVGTNGVEFVNTIDNIAGNKIVPETDEQIKEFMKSRCPFCHMSVMMKKQALLDAGGYEDWYYAEDWYLWIRMALSGAKFYNIQENLMQIRINEDTYARRHGMKYFKSIKGLLKYMRKYKLCSYVEYIKNCAVRYVGHVLVPRKFKARLYKKFMRGKNSD